MNYYVFIFSLLSIILSLIATYLQQSLVKISEKNTCNNLCYGDNLCKDFEDNKIALRYKTITDFIFNFISVKNVFYATYLGEDVVLKKLGNSYKIEKIGQIATIINNVNSVEEEIINRLLIDEEQKDFSACDKSVSKQFLKQLLANYNLKQILTILSINVEPLLLTTFNKKHHWPVPELLGFCGRLTVVEDCGKPLDSVKNYSWFDRAFIAYQLMKTAKNFTEDHEYFRLYLTDISPDNIVVDENLKISYIDLGNAVLAAKNTKVLNVHQSEHFNEDNFVFSIKQICSSSVSDHNIYGMCRLLLSKNAPWPMMDKGLLHSPPQTVLYANEDLFLNVEHCVIPQSNISRFKISNSIVQSLKQILFPLGYNV